MIHKVNCHPGESMSNTDKWSISEVVEKHGRDIVHWKKTEGLGRCKAATRLTEQTGRVCTAGVMGVAFERLGFGNAKRARMDIRDENPPREDPLSIQQLIKSRIKAFERDKVRGDVHKRVLQMPPEPFGICILGDPHVDNEGCDWPELMRVIETCQSTEGIVVASVGDQTDNWVGRLQKKFADTSCLASDGWRLSKYLLEELDFIALVGGNHDGWSMVPGVDPLKWISEDARVRCYAPDEIRITLKFTGENDYEPLVWVLRHDCSGRSWFHPSHGPNKMAMLDGKVHLVTAGHIHTWAYLQQEAPHGRVTHAIRVRGFKRNDEYAISKGFREDWYGCACLVVVDPACVGPDRLKIFWDVDRGAEHLTRLRAKSAESMANAKVR